MGERKTQRRGSQLSISDIRSVLYGTARALGDVQAVRRGRIVERLGRRLSGRLASRILGRLSR